MPTVLTKQANGTTILRETHTSEELGREEAILTAANMNVDDLRRYEERLRAKKATRTGPLLLTKYKSAAQQNLERKRLKIKARKVQEARTKQEENTIKNLLAKGVRPYEVRQLFKSLEEIDKAAATWKYIDSQVIRNV